MKTSLLPYLEIIWVIINFLHRFIDIARQKHWEGQFGEVVTARISIRKSILEDVRSMKTVTGIRTVTESTELIRTLGNYRVCHGFRLKKRDDYFSVNFDHFMIEQNFWRQKGQYWRLAQPKTEPRLGNLACPNNSLNTPYLTSHLQTHTNILSLFYFSLSLSFIFLAILNLSLYFSYQFLYNSLILSLIFLFLV